MHRLAAAAVLGIALVGCGGASDDAGASRTAASDVTTPDSTAPASTPPESATSMVTPTYLTQPPRARDDEITQASADASLRCAHAVADLVHFDPSWISAPPPTLAEVDPALLDIARSECASAAESIAADLEPGIEIGWAHELAFQVQMLADGVNASEVDMAADSGMPMAFLNIQGMIDGSFFGGRPGLVIS